MPRYSFMRRAWVAVAAGLMLAACAPPAVASRSSTSSETPASFAPCTDLTLTSVQGRLQAPGTTMKFTAAVKSCSSPVYRFFAIDRYGIGVVAQDWSSSASYVLPTSPGASPGTYAISVDTRDASDPKVEQTATTSYVLGCTSLTIDASPTTSPQPPGTSVVFTATSSTCSSPVYQFWVVDPNGVSLLAQSSSSKASFTWTTTAGEPLGTYTIRVEVRGADDWNSELVYTVSYALAVPPSPSPTP